MVSKEKLLKHLNYMRDKKISRAKKYPVDHPYFNVYSAEAVLIEEIIDWIVIEQESNVTVNFSSKLHEGREKVFNQIKQTTSESLRSSFIGYAAGIHAHPYKEQSDEDYMDYCRRFFEGDVWKQKRQDILDLNKPLTKEDVSFDLNGKVPKLYIKGQEVGVVVMTNHYVTSDYENEGVNVITFVYLIGGNPEQKVLSIDQITGEVMHQ
ncbi:hypothetical protein [Enterococcus dongliensis]|uniref:hypothetical protein n=1 Tax=Enterococcus dongliensis TaxID=2559925 RepID=UPI002898A278|nr:hypothetical protein [Enterococcus dongliensis]